MSSRRLSIDQKRAARAWEEVDKINQEYREQVGNNYVSLVRSAPAMIQSSGLGQTLAFYLSKAGSTSNKITEHRLLYSHLSNWVMDNLATEEKDKEMGLLEWIVQQDTQIYRRATVETLAFLTWLKRFAEAILPDAVSFTEWNRG